MTRQPVYSMVRGSSRQVPRQTPMNLDYMHPREGAMLQRQLHQMELQAHALRRALHPHDNVPAWTQAKVATAQDRLSAAHGYLTHKIDDGMDWGGITDADFAYAFSDFGEVLDDGEDDDLGDLGGSKSKARKARRLKRKRSRKSRRFKRAKKKGKTSRQVAIVLRIAVKAAKYSGKKVNKRKAMKAAKKSAKTTKTVRRAVLLGLKAGGLSESDARKFATIGIAYARRGGSKKGVAQALKKLATRRKRFLRKKKITALKKKKMAEAAKIAKEEAAVEEEEQDVSEDQFDEEDFSEEDAQDVEDADDEEFEDEDEDEDDEDFEDDDDLSGIIADSFDRAKPYLPWALVAVGFVAVVTSARNAPTSRKRK